MTELYRLSTTSGAHINDLGIDGRRKQAPLKAKCWYSWASTGVEDQTHHLLLRRRAGYRASDRVIIEEIWRRLRTLIYD